MIPPETFHWLSDVVSGIGLFGTAMGATVTARSVILSENDAITIGLARFGGETREQNLRLPAVQNLLNASKGARWGLYIIVAGSALQLAPIVGRLIAPYL